MPVHAPSLPRRGVLRGRTPPVPAARPLRTGSLERRRPYGQATGGSMLLAGHRRAARGAHEGSRASEWALLHQWDGRSDPSGGERYGGEMTLRLGLGLPQMKHYAPGRDVTRVAQEAEACGYDSLWVFE